MIMENILTKVLPQEGGLAGSRSGVYNGVIGLLGVFTLIGVAFGTHAMFIGHEHYTRTEEFIALYDNPAFDAQAETLPIEEFEPMLRRVFAQPRNSIYKAALEKQGAAA